MKINDESFDVILLAFDCEIHLSKMDILSLNSQ